VSSQFLEAWALECIRPSISSMNNIHPYFSQRLKTVLIFFSVSPTRVSRNELAEVARTFFFVSDAIFS